MKRFRYALEPVLLTRRWDLDARLLTLSEQTSALAAHQRLIDATEVRFAAAAEASRALTTDGASYTLDEFALLSRYLGDLTRQCSENARRMDELETARDDAAAAVLLAQRSLDAAEQHRDTCHTDFMQQRASADFKLADDQWNMLHTGAIAHDN